MNKIKHTVTYIIFDFLAALVAWASFFVYRKYIIESKLYGNPHDIIDNNFLLGIIVVPVFWILVYYIYGYYHDIYRKSRLKELAQTFSLTIFGVLLIFFKLIIDDFITSYTDYYKSIFYLISAQFILTYIPRLIITSSTINRINKRIIGFKTILVGTNGQAAKIYREIKDMKNSPGNLIIGYVNIENTKNDELEGEIENLGDFENLHQIISDNGIEEVIIAIESKEQDKIQKILTKLLLTNVKVKILPSMFDIVTGYAKLDTHYKTPFIEIENRSITITQANIKRLIDIVFSMIAILILLPVYIAVAIGVKITSRGKIFYVQERIGKNLKPFKIIKFRSMYSDAEKNGPALSSTFDNRITPFGKFLRKTRLDEIPQFINVIVGHMSLVGPRPERQFYIDQIVEVAPYYLSLLKTKPGITSLGQVKYGYAENVDQMVERLKYDLIYLQNMSIYLDFKIMILTLKTVFEASGK